MSWAEHHLAVAGVPAESPVRSRIFDDELLELAIAEARRFGFTLAELRSPSRKRPLVSARRAVASAAHEAGFSYMAIGRVLNRDHSTIIYALRPRARRESASAPTPPIRSGRCAAVGL